MQLLGRSIDIDLRNRALLWVLLLLLTTILLFYPVRLICEYHSIQAPYIFENLPLFCVLFCVWILLLLLLAMSKRDDVTRLDWENLALACVFGVVFLGFWVVVTPYGSAADDLYNTAHVKWLEDTGRIALDQGSLGYFNFPGMHLLAAAFSACTGLTIFESRTLFLVFNAVLFSALLYVLFVRLLRSSRLAFIGVLLAVMGSVLIVERMRVFFPSSLGFTLLAGCLVLLTRSETKLFGATVCDRLVMIVLFAAMVISYFPTSLLVILMVLGVYAVQVLARDKKALVSLPMMSLFLVMLFAWELFWAQGNLGTYAPFISNLWESMRSGEFVTAPLSMARANSGASLPLWANTTRFFWWALIVFGTLLGLYYLIKVTRLNLAERIATGGLLGVLMLSVFGLFGTEGGYEFQRFLMYAPLLCIPVLLMFASRSVKWRRRSLILLTAIVVILAIPTFLCSVNTVSTDAIYAHDLHAGEFLSSKTSEGGKDLAVYGISPESVVFPRYYVQNAEITVIPGKFFYKGQDGELWQKVDELLAGFETPRPWGVKQKVLVISEASFTPYQHLLSISVDDPRWLELREVTSRTNLIYSNGHVRVYTR